MLRLCIFVLSFVVMAVPAAAEISEPAGTAMVVGLQQHNAGTFYIAGALEGYGDINFLVDTGSSYMVINEAMLAELQAAGNAQPARQLSGLMADGTRRVIPTYFLKSLRLGDACWIGEVEAAIIPGNARPILGMAVLARLAPFTFSAQPAQLALTHCQSAPAPAPIEVGSEMIQVELPVELKPSATAPATGAGLGGQGAGQ